MCKSCKYSSHNFIFPLKVSHLLLFFSPLCLTLSWRLSLFPLHPFTVLWFSVDISFPQLGEENFLYFPRGTVPHLILNSRKPYWNKLVFDRMNKKTFVFLSFSRNWGLRNIEKWCYFYFILIVSFSEEMAHTHRKSNL